MILLPLYVIFAFVLLGKVTFIFSLIAFIIFTYIQFYKNKTKKQPLSIEEFLSMDPDIVKALRLLHDNNTYRTDINDSVGNLVYIFVSIYIQLLFDWDRHQYDSLLDIERNLLETISSLEYERDNIPYRDVFILMELFTMKYKNVLSKKYNFELNAPNSNDNKFRHNMK